MSAVAQHPIRLAEELILQMLDERSGYLEMVPGSDFSCVMAGAVLADLAQGPAHGIGRGGAAVAGARPRNQPIPVDLDLRIEAPPRNVYRGRVARFAGPTLEDGAR